MYEENEEVSKGKLQPGGAMRPLLSDSIPLASCATDDFYQNIGIRGDRRRAPGKTEERRPCVFVGGRIPVLSPRRWAPRREYRMVGNLIANKDGSETAY